MTNLIDFDHSHDRNGPSLPRRHPASRQPCEDHVHDCVVVVLSDEGLLDGPDELRHRLGGVLEPGPAKVVLDLSRVSRLSSTTIATLLWVKRTCRSRAVELVVRRPSRGSVGILLRTGLITSGSVRGPSRRSAAVIASTDGDPT